MSLRMKQRAPSNFITERDIAEEEELMRCTEKFQRVSANFCWQFCQFHSISFQKEKEKEKEEERESG